jgi:two-component system capsular synthesis response regulator RcsB
VTARKGFFLFENFRSRNGSRVIFDAPCWLATFFGALAQEVKRSMRIVIEDEQEFARIGVRMVLERKGFQVTGEASSGQALLELLANCTCDLLIYSFVASSGDLTHSGLTLLRRIRQLREHLPKIVMTTLDDPAWFAQIYAEGASAVISKSSSTQEFLQALNTVLLGRTYISQRVSKKIALDGNQSTRLSAREAEVVHMFTHGMRVCDIARKNALSVKTISQQKRDAMRKLGITCDVHLYEYARRHGL